MRIEQLQLWNIRVMRAEAEFAVEEARKANDPDALARVEAHLALALDTERQAVELMQANGIPTEWDDDDE
jgi:hypothetical protein